VTIEVYWEKEKGNIKGQVVSDKRGILGKGKRKYKIYTRNRKYEGFK
jgi:hypothetical protein